MAAAKTVSDVWVNGELVPAGSGPDSPAALKISNPAAWEDGEVPPAVTKAVAAAAKQ